jgi:hypothetical protein
MRHTVQINGSTGQGTSGFADEETVSGARYREIVQPGASTTVYAQAFLILFASDPIQTVPTIHANMQLDFRITKGAALL